MFRLAILFGLLGLCAAVGLIVWQGYDEILKAFAAAGWGIVWASLFHLVPLFMASIAWWVLFNPRNRPSLMFMALVMWLRVSVNNLMPVARIGGEVLAVRVMMKNGIAKGPAIASTVVETTISVLTVFLFIAMGILMFANHNPDTDILIRLLIGVLVSLPVIGVFIAVQRAGIFGFLAKVVRLIVGDRWRHLDIHISHIDRAIMTMYRRGKLIAASVAWMFASWVVGAGQIWIALYFLGMPLSFAECIILEAMIQAVSSAAFAVPGALGAQEGAFLFFGGLLGLTPEIALALALIRRCRDLILYVPGLIVWQIMEGRWLLRKSQAA